MVNQVAFPTQQGMQAWGTKFAPLFGQFTQA